MGHAVRGRWLYWFYPLERYTLALVKARRLFNKIRFVSALLLGVTFWLWGGWSLYLSFRFPTALTQLNPVSFGVGRTSELLFWFGVICFCYAWYRSIREKDIVGAVEHYDYREAPPAQSQSPSAWADVFRTPRKTRHNIAETFTAEALQALGTAYQLADMHGDATVEPAHVLFALLNSNRISMVFIRLGIMSASIQKALGALFPAAEARRAAPQVSSAVQQILFQAYAEAYAAHQEYVSVTELLLATVKQSPPIQEMLYDLGVVKQKLVNVVEWARIRERLYRQYKKFHKAARHRSKKGMDRAMTAVATPFLNQFSDDLTVLAQLGYTEPCIAREKEIEEVFRIVDGGQQSVMLVGDYGVGKRSIVEGIAERMVEDDVPARLKDRRMVRLSIPTLLAGTTPSGAVERLIRIMSEISRARNIILFIHNLHELIGVSAGGEQSLDVASTLAEYLSGGNFMTFATTTTQAYAHDITNSKLSSVFTKVDVAEMDENQAIQVVESKIGSIEYKQKVFFAYTAIEKAVALSKRFIHEVYLPGSALEVVTEAASYAHDKKGANSLVTGEEVAAVVAQKTHIPVTTVTADETTKLLNLETAMHERVVGQDEAVNLVANALRRARAEMRSQSRPIANFLFLGPTGVGKTELAKTIAAVYFGGEERMVRLDMSEYQDKASMNRLIGAAGEKGSGILTEAIRRGPFSLLLLDEIEKADKDVLNLFLQVMDDGRLTDSTGHVVDFTNVILIATSNAGTAYVQEQLNKGLSSDAIKERLLHGELGQYFRPEFLNRFDGIVLFKALSQADIKKVASFMLKRVAKDLDAKGIQLEIEDAALDYLAKAGFDPDFGARPMRRALQERVENQLADLLLSGKLKRRDVVVIGEGGAITVK